MLECMYAICQALSTVYHKILLHKLSHYEIKDIVNYWFLPISLTENNMSQNMDLTQKDGSNS